MSSIKRVEILVCVLMLAVILAGCGEKEALKYASSSETIEETKVSEQQLELLKTATHAEVWTFTKNWDEDAEDDGIAVYITLKDEKDETVKI